MVLCVSNIFWSPSGITEDGLPIEPHPELEITDGWYRLRAQVDLPLARAVRRGILRVGGKIGVAGARVRPFHLHCAVPSSIEMGYLLNKALDGEEGTFGNYGRIQLYETNVYGEFLPTHALAL